MHANPPNQLTTNQPLVGSDLDYLFSVLVCVLFLGVVPQARRLAGTAGVHAGAAQGGAGRAGRRGRSPAPGEREGRAEADCRAAGRRGAVRGAAEVRALFFLSIGRNVYACRVPPHWELLLLSRFSGFRTLLSIFSRAPPGVAIGKKLPKAWLVA